MEEKDLKGALRKFSVSTVLKEPQERIIANVLNKEYIRNYAYRWW